MTTNSITLSVHKLWAHSGANAAPKPKPKQNNIAHLVRSYFGCIIADGLWVGLFFFSAHVNLINRKEKDAARTKAQMEGNGTEWRKRDNESSRVESEAFSSRSCLIIKGMKRKGGSYLPDVFGRGRRWGGGDARSAADAAAVTGTTAAAATTVHLFQRRALRWDGRL